MSSKIQTIIFIYVFYFCPHQIECRRSKLTNGVEAVEGDFPSYVMLRENLDALPLCAGALVSRKHVLTIASCVASSPEHISFRGILLAGTVSTTKCPAYSCQIRKSGNIYIHPEYKPTEQQDVDSVAIVFAENPFSMDYYVKPVGWTSKSSKNELVMSGISTDQSGVYLAYVQVTEPNTCLISGEMPKSLIVVRSREPPYTVAKDIDKGSPVYDWNEKFVGLVSPLSQFGLNCTPVRTLPDYADFIDDLILSTPKKAYRGLRKNDSGLRKVACGGIVLSVIVFIPNCVKMLQ